MPAGDADDWPRAMTRFRTRAGPAEKIPWWSGCLLVALLAFACPAVANPVLADGNDTDVWLSPDQRTVFFSRDGDLYIATR